MNTMKVGDLVTVRPAEDGLYVITSMEVYDLHNNLKHLPDCVMLISQSVPSYGAIPMGKEFVEVISEAS